MMIKYKRPVLVLSLIAMTACGSTKDSGSGTPDPVTFAERDTQFDTLETTLTGLAPTDRGALPDAGAFTYTGVMSMTIQEGDPLNETRMLGDMSLTADFGTAAAVTGEVTNVTDNFEVAYTGTLNVTAGLIDGAAIDHVFTADLGGELRDPANGLYDVNAAIDGDFYGDAYEYASGDVGGEINTPDGLFAIGDGDYIVAR